jgi:hypothetical protein
MKPTINRKGNPGMLRVDGRPDRSKAPLIKPQVVEVKPVIKPKKEAVTLTPLDPQQPYPQEDEVKPSGVIPGSYWGNEPRSKKKGNTNER